MPAIKLTDALGLDLGGSLSQDSKLLQLLPAFMNFADLPLDQVRDADLSVGLNLAEPLPVPADGLALKLCAGACASFTLLRPRQHALDEDDPFSEIEIQDDELYLMMALRFSLGATVSGTAESFTFGFSPEGELEIRCCRRFKRVAGSFPAFRKALATTASSFVLPKEAADLSALQPDAVLVLRGSGTLAASAGVSVALPTESLASVSLVLNQKLRVTAGASVGVTAGLTLSGAYQVRLRWLDGRRAELGVYTMKSHDAALNVAADIGASANVGQFDLGKRVIGALSPKPAVDVEEFEKALPDEDDEAKTARLAAFQESIKAGICTKLKLSAGAALNAQKSHEAVWVFEIDTDVASTNEAHAALASAFDGKLDALTRDPRALPAGITQKSNVLTDAGFHEQTLKINLLGLVNLISTGKLAQVTTVQRNANGDITLITDSSSENRLQALLVIFGNDGKRLRKLLSENFLITAAYRAKDLGLLPPEFQARHTYFAVQDSTSREEMKNELDVMRILGRRDAGFVQQQLGDRNEFGRSTIFAETRYDGDAVRDAFLKPQQAPASEDVYDRIGREALGALLQDDRGQEFRKRVANDDALWAALKKDGNRANFARIFGLSAGALDPRVEAAGVDFSVITGWAEAMTAAGNALQEIDGLLGAGGAGADAAKLDKARELLKKRLGQVVKNTKEEFGDPLGMIMFYKAANERGDPVVLITGNQIQRLELKPPAVIVTHASS